ncbi:nitroreductase family deazaflavin-dependent oxidoreductase [Rhodococcus sp. IEGM 1381]|uniref:nitroreductase family deazaflavin-dependent oxidoreductase n=1 Tax=Rhodococcus sp. IEGM 1381 TaxID=3047085 RepID=UPI0024B66E09|nr:nitroreductase family deazaflavin-dependent oxidoreductase [Rhodococcus sp. IEGM 1381]MDI9894494.1 nitroreductase family deazaflavin-dependent oxidoreductase [Rhodococcus sp. IEGM 1381]
MTQSQPDPSVSDRSVTLSDQLTLACGQVLPNRLMKSALSEGLADTSHGPDTRLERLYSQWGAGGYGLVVTGNVMVDRRHLGEPGNVVIEDDRHAEQLARWAKTTTDGGSRIWMQLNHPGRQANPIASREQAVSPSGVAVAIPGIPAPRPLTESEIYNIIERFATAALVAESSGFDGVQLHGAHGYLVSQFLSPLVNRRTDKWGGDIESRMRFAVEVIRAIRAAVSPSFAVSIKLNSADFQRGGFTEEESRLVVERLAGEHIDLVEISGGSYESPAMMGRGTEPVKESTREREAYFLDYARTVREVAGEVPLAVTGGFRTRSVMVDALSSGDCDVIGLGRPAAISPSAAGSLLDGSTERLVSPVISVGAARRIKKVKSLEGALDLQWHTDQLHRLGAGKKPDPDRSAWRTVATMVERNGITAFRSSRRGLDTTAADAKAIKKFRFERLVGRYVANPMMRGLTALGISVSLMSDIETTGRKTGRVRRVPVSVKFDDAGAWLVSQHGTRSGWGANITSNPTVKLRQGKTWREGSAEFIHDDDVALRARSFAPNPFLGKLIGSTFAALQTTPVTVRVTFTDLPN